MTKTGILLTNIGFFWLRVLTGMGIAHHGYGKIMGGKMDGFAMAVGNMGIPFPEFGAWAAALSELVGGCLILIGLATRVSSFFVFITMSVAVFVAHASDPLASKELALAYQTLAAFLVLAGPGAISLDKLFFREQS